MIHRHSRKNFLIPILVFITASTHFCKKESEELKSLKRDANIAYVKQDLNGALALFSQVLEMDSDSTNTMIMLGKIYYYKKILKRRRRCSKTRRIMENVIQTQNTGFQKCKVYTARIVWK